MTTLVPAPKILSLEAVVQNKDVLIILRDKDRSCSLFVGDNKKPVCQIEWSELEKLKDFLDAILHPNAVL